MWKKGDRIKRSSPVHGEMTGTIDEVTAGVNQTIYHVTWQTSKTGTIQSRELSGRDDRNWESLSGPGGRAGEVIDKVSVSAAIASAIDQDPGLSSNHTRRAYLADLGRFEAWAGKEPLSQAIVIRYIAALEEQGKSTRLINRGLAAIRWWARRKMEFAVEAVHMPPATMVQIFAESLAIARIPDLPMPTPVQAPAISAEEFSRLILSSRNDPSPGGVRDTALFSLAYFQGIKPGMLRRLRREQLTPSDRDSHRLYVTSSRGHQKTYELYQPASAACQAWVDIRDNNLTTLDQAQPLFLAINKGGKILEKGLSGEALRQVLKKRQQQAGLNNITWHRLCRAK
jgi:site-specific recombinase XerD